MQDRTSATGIDEEAGAGPADWLQASLVNAVEQAAEGVVITDAQGRLQYVNPAFSRMTGYSAAEVLGQTPRMLKSGKQESAFYRDMWDTILAGRVWHGEVINRRKNGAFYLEEMTISPVCNAAGTTTNYIAIKQDVTSRHAAEEASGFLASIVQSTQDAVIGHTLDGVIMTWNRAAAELYGYRAEEAVGQPVEMLIAPELRERSRGFTQGISQGESVPQYDSAAVRKTGERVSVSVSLSPVRNAAGNVIAAAAIVRDMTQHNRDVEALRNSEERFRTVFENAPFGMCLSTPAMQLVEVNGAFCRMLGYSQQELVQLGWGPVTHPDDLPISKDAIDCLLRAKPTCAEFEKRYLHRDGHVIWARVSVSVLEDVDGSWCFVTQVEDITQTRLTSETLRRSEEKYRRLLANLPDVTWTVASQGQTTYISSNATAMFGYTPEEICQTPDLWTSTLHPEDRSAVLEAFAGLFAGNRPYDVEYRIRRKDGRWIRVHSRAMRTFEEDGILYADGVVTDITGRCEAEEALRESEEKYRALITNIPDVVWTADAARHSTFVSRNCQAMLGYTPEEICRPDGWFGLIDPVDRERVETEYRKLFSGGQGYNFEYRVRHKDGRMIWVRDRAVTSYVRDGQLYADGCISDVTEYKLRSQLIERLQRRTEFILNSAGEGILGLDADGNLTFVNPAAARMVGAPRVQLVGRDLHAVLRHSDGNGGKCTHAHCVILASLRDGKEHRGTGNLFRLADGDGFPVEFTSTPKIEDGRMMGAVVVLRDVTEARRTEERIKASLKEKEALLREIHHRVKNNLQIVCSLLKLNARSLQDPAAKLIFEDTQHRVKAMAMVHETLYRSGNLAGIDFCDYVPKLAEHLLHAYGLSARQVPVTLDVESVILPIDVAIPCALMLTELITNSAKHAFSVERRGQLWIAFRRASEPSWLMEVRDSGSSAPPETAPVKSGSSFGLELVKLLTEQLNGELRITRNPGFCVSIVFPLSEAAGEK